MSSITSVSERSTIMISSTNMKNSLTIKDKQTAQIHVDEEFELEIPRPQQGAPPAGDLRSPNISVDLEWVYGYRGRDAHKTIVYVGETNELVYFTACIAILHNVKRKRQRFYREHDSHIRCIALHPDQITIATGQDCGHHKRRAIARVLIWKADTLETLRTLGLSEELMDSVIQVCFSIADGGFNAGVVSVSDSYKISVWDWNSEKMSIRSYEFQEPICDLRFNPLDVSPQELVSFGRGQLFSWLLKKEGVITYSPIVSKRKKEPSIQPPHFMCFGFSPEGHLVAGDSTGHLHIWLHETKEMSISTFSGSSSPVTCICFTRDGRLYTGNQDGLIAGWDNIYLRRIVFSNVHQFLGCARTIVLNSHNTMFIGTTKNCILTSKLGLPLRILVFSHADTIHGLSPHGKIKFATAGKDKRVILWDAVNHCHAWHAEVRFPASSVAVSPCDSVVAVGGITGQWVLLNGKVGHVMEYGRACCCPINCIGFSPVGSYIAMGAQNGDVYIYNVNEKTLSLLGKLTQPYGPVTHLDWAVDSYHIRTCSNNCNIFYWSIPKCAADDSDYVKYDHYWWTKSCTMTYLSAGIWSEAVNLTDITSVDVNSSEKLMASGNDYGEVGVYKYPCPTLKANKITKFGHGSTLSGVLFIKGMERLISIGGNDWTIFQWNHFNEKDSTNTYSDSQSWNEFQQQLESLIL